MESFDLVVIGAGPGGYPAAIRGAQLGASVALVEKEQLGGACLNWGCIPTKTLIASAERFSQISNAADLGIQAEGVSFDYAFMAERKDRVVGRLRNGVAHLLSANRVKVFKGQASFEERNRIRIESESGTTFLQAGKTIVATGSKSVMPSFLPEHERVFDSRGFLDLRTLPASVIILGGGVIGCEFACMLAQLQVQVTVVELLEDILLVLDPDVRREVRRHMQKTLGIRLLTGHPIGDVTADGKSVSARVAEEHLSAEALLCAVGRRPMTEGLRLERAGLAIAETGSIKVDSWGQTPAPTIFAIGDVTGGMQLAHAATSQGIVAAENACTGRLRRNERFVPSCIFTCPEIGVVGMSEDDARKEGVDVLTGKFPFGASGKAMAMDEARGFVKWIADVATGQLLGAQAVGPHATELIAQATLALRAELTAKELASTIHAHPTLAEAWMESAHDVLGGAIHLPPMRQERL